MMGKSHLIVGSAGWLLATPALAAVGIPLVPATIAAGTVVATGAAMMPDLDHPQATVSRSLGKVSQTFLNILLAAWEDIAKAPTRFSSLPPWAFL